MADLECLGITYPGFQFSTCSLSNNNNKKKWPSQKGQKKWTREAVWHMFSGCNFKTTWTLDLLFSLLCVCFDRVSSKYERLTWEHFWTTADMAWNDPSVGHDELGILVCLPLKSRNQWSHLLQSLHCCLCYWTVHTVAKIKHPTTIICDGAQDLCLSLSFPCMHSQGEPLSPYLRRKSKKTAWILGKVFLRLLIHLKNFY